MVNDGFQLEFVSTSWVITGHVIYNPAYTYKFQLKTTIDHLLGVPMFLREDYFLKTAAVSKVLNSKNTNIFFEHDLLT